MKTTVALLGVVCAAAIVVSWTIGFGGASSVSGPSISDSGGTLLVDIPPVKENRDWDVLEDLVVGDVRFSSGVSPNNCPTGQISDVEFSLDGSFELFKARVGMRSLTSESKAAQVELFADGQPVWGESVSLTSSHTVDLDVSGVSVLRVLVTGLSEDQNCGDDFGPVIAGGVLAELGGDIETAFAATQSPLPQTGNTQMRMEELTVKTGDPEFGSLSIEGQQYAHGFRSETCNEGDTDSIEVGLNKQFNTFTAVVGVTDESTEAMSAEIEILIDGTSTWTEQVKLGTSHTIEIPVKDALSMRIEIRALSNIWCGQNEGPAFGDSKLVG